jgi:hypothetical protein
MIIQRFPEKDWKDTPFIDGIEWVITKLLFRFIIIIIIIVLIN